MNVADIFTSIVTVVPKTAETICNSATKRTEIREKAATQRVQIQCDTDKAMNHEKCSTCIQAISCVVQGICSVVNTYASIKNSNRQM